MIRWFRLDGPRDESPRLIMRVEDGFRNRTMQKTCWPPAGGVPMPLLRSVVWGWEARTPNAEFFLRRSMTLTR